jgi:hypothetical protein
MRSFSLFLLINQNLMCHNKRHRSKSISDVIVASHELRFVLPRSKKRHPRQLTVAAASRGVFAMCVHGFTANCIHLSLRVSACISKYSDMHIQCIVCLSCPQSSHSAKALPYMPANSFVHQSTPPASQFHLAAHGGEERRQK